MCGLIAAFNLQKRDEDVTPFIVDQYEDQFTRGSRGFGIIRIDKDNNIDLDRATEPAKFMFDLHKAQAPGMIVHHRTPTSSDNRLDQTHPIYVSNESLSHDYLVIHNGIVSNDKEIKVEHEKIGFAYTTEVNYTDNTVKFNDSESLAIELARFIEKQTKVIGARGSAAFIILQLNKENQTAEKLFFGRHLNPLNLAKSQKEMKLSSEGPGAAITEDTLYSCTIDDVMKLHKQKMAFATYVSTATVFDDEEYKKYSGGAYSLEEDWDKNWNKDDEYDNAYAIELIKDKVADIVEQFNTDCLMYPEYTNSKDYAEEIIEELEQIKKINQKMVWDETLTDKEDAKLPI